MYIKELMIEEFAALSNKKIQLSRDFNLITGANETGKSSVCAFIKFIFYGFIDAKERELHSSLKTKNSAGSMIIEHEGKTYRIARRVRGRAQTVTVYDEQDGSEFTDWQRLAQTPGEYFLNIPHQLYTRSVYVSQETGAMLDGGSAEAISNLLLTGDESISLKRAKKVLEDTRKALKLKRGVGGMIADAEKRLELLHQKRTAAIESRREHEAIIIALRNEKTKLSELDARISDVKAELLSTKTKKIYDQLNQLDTLNEEITKLDILLDGLCKDVKYNGFTPDSEYEEALLTLSKELSHYSDEVRRIENRLISLRASINANPPKEYDPYCKLGKKEAILPVYDSNRTAFKVFGIGFIVSGFLMLVSLIALGMRQLGIFSGSGVFITGLLAVSAFGTISLGIARFFPKRTLSRLNSALYADSIRSVHDICRDCQAYEKRISSSDLSYLEQLLNESTEKKLSAEQKSDELLARWNKKSIDVALSDYRAYKEKLSSLTAEKQRVTNSASIVKALLSSYTDNEIESARKFVPSTDSVAASLVSAEELDRLTELKRDTEKRCTEFEIQSAKIISQTELDEILSDIESTEKALCDYRFKYEAISLAITSLENAELSIRRTVSPYLSEHASKYFADITLGKYSKLRLDSEMNLSYTPSDTENLTDSVYLSTGSSDLAWLCLRLALHKRLSENVMIPIILDEALVYFDDSRLALILEQLTSNADDGIQVILFSASSRERALLPEYVTHITLG